MTKENLAIARGGTLYSTLQEISFCKLHFSIVLFIATQGATSEPLHMYKLVLGCITRRFESGMKRFRGNQILLVTLLGP